MAGLEELDLRRTRVSNNGVEKLCQYLPNCHIENQSIDKQY